MGLGATYDVEIDIEVKDKSQSGLSGFVSKLDQIDGAAGAIGGKITGALGGIADTFTGAAEAAGMFGMKLGALGAGGLLAGVAYGVLHVNAELEKTQISLAAIFNANGAAHGMDDAMHVSADQMSKMRKDAAALPGEFTDLVQIMRAATIPGLRSGMKVDDIRTMSASVMATAAASGMQMDVAAREFGMLLNGRAGAHNILGSNMFGLQGAEAEKFNKMDGGKRVDFLKKGMTGYTEAIDVFSHSWEGVTSSASQNFKTVMGAATRWIFEDIKVAFARVNAWFDANESKIMQWAEGIGTNLHNAFQWGLSMFDKYWPTILNLGAFIQDKIVSLFEKAAPIVSIIAEKLAGVLKDPGALFDKMMTVGKLFLAVKGGGMLWDVASGAGGASKGLMGGIADIGGGGGAGGAGGGELGMFAAVAGKLQDSVGGLVTLGVFVGLISTLGPVFAVLVDETSVFHEKAMTVVGDIKDHLTGIWVSLSHIFGSSGSILPMIEGFGLTTLKIIEEIIAAFDTMMTGIERVVDTFKGTLAALESVITSLGHKFEWLFEKIMNTPIYKALIGGANDTGNDIRIEKLGASDSPDLSDGRYSVDLSSSNAGLYALQAIETNTKPTKHEPKGHGVHVDKVEITVSGNDDPSRVARIVVAELSNLRRHPRASQFVTNFSSGT